MDFLLCPSPDLFAQYAPSTDTFIVVTDVFRASATILSALYHGAQAVIPVATEEEAQSYLHCENYVVAAERNALRCSFATLGNDPEECLPEIVQGKQLVLTTTNGTRSLDIARQAGCTSISVGSFGNITPLARYILTQHPTHILVIAAGWKGTLCAEDCLFAAALYEKVLHLAQEKSSQSSLPFNDALLFPLEVYRQQRNNLIAYTAHFEHYQRLIRLGRKGTIPICLQEDRYPIVPLLTADGRLLPLSSESIIPIG